MSAHTAHSDAHHHVTSLQTYFAVYGALLVFTVLTYAVSFANLGPFAFFVAMLVATVKAGLVCTYFMHMKYDERFNVLIFLSSLFFVGLFFAFTIIDESSRGIVNPEETRHYYLSEQAAAAAASAEAAPAADAAAAPTEAAAADAAHGGAAAPAEAAHANAGSGEGSAADGSGI